MKKATFFGGSMNDTSSVEYIETVKIGTYLADKNYNIISGGYRGLMEGISKGASLSNNKVHIIGYTCETFGHYSGNRYLTEEKKCSTIFTRLEKLIDSSDLYIIQKGGIGTLSELFLTLDIIRKYKENIPKIILIGSFWKTIFNSLKILITEKEFNLITFVDNYEEFTKIDI